MWLACGLRIDVAVVKRDAMGNTVRAAINYLQDQLSPGQESNLGFLNSADSTGQMRDLLVQNQPLNQLCVLHCTSVYHRRRERVRE